MVERLYHSMGQRLVEERSRLGWTQEQMAEVGGVAKRTQGNYERGERGPEAGYLEQLAHAGVDVQYVLTGVRSVNVDKVAEEAAAYNKEKEKPEGVGVLSREEAAVVALYRHLRPKDRAHARAVIDALASVVKPKDSTGSD